MSKEQDIIVADHETSEGSFKSYVTGFVLSIILTLVAYLMVVHHSFTADRIIAVIVALALCQFMVQMLFFLHLGKETKPRWKLFVLFFMIMVVLILVFGSIWIMNNLNYRMTPEQINTYINNQGGGF
jgi:cytochrome o ubiquinol oxidase operon protein cyoD